MARSSRDDRSGRNLRKDLLQGAVLGAVVYAAAYGLRIPKALLEADQSWAILAAAGVGAVLSAVRLRSVLWVLCAAASALFVVVAMTPVFSRSALNLVERDQLRKADAVVVLGSSTTRERKLDDVAFIRTVEGMRLVQDGLAPVLVWTRVGGQYPDPSADVEELASLCGGVKTVRVGPVLSTRDEAMKVADLAHARRWKSVILVTSPYHSSRAAAVFRKLGLDVISYPSSERMFSITKPRSTRERVEVFRWWLYEHVRWTYYRARGWI